MNKTQITNADLVERFPQIRNKTTAMKAVMDVLKESLEPAYQGLEVRPYFENRDIGILMPLYAPELKGYHLIQKTKLDQPERTIKKSLFGLIKTQVTKTHDKRNIAYGGIESSALDVLVYESEVLQACEEIARKTQGGLRVRL